MKKPILLTKKELTKPISEAISRLDSIHSHMTSHQEKIIFEGFFILAIASFETAIIDTLKVLLKHIPSKLTTNSITLPKEDILNKSSLDFAIEAHLLSLSYKNINDIINGSLKQLSIEIDKTSEELNILQEGKARRNLLIHNNLRVNRVYEETAGPLKSNDKVLAISLKYLSNFIRIAKSTLTKYRSSIDEKYKDYTKVKALKALFDYCFSTPVMKFEDEWIVDEKRDLIVAYNSEKSRRGALSGSEQTLFSFWHIHICGLDPEVDSLNFWGLSDGNRQKVAYLLSILDIFQT
jgi:hypothetical protein